MWVVVYANFIEHYINIPYSATNTTFLHMFRMLAYNCLHCGQQSMQWVAIPLSSHIIIHYAPGV